MSQAITCPACGEAGLDVASYDSMMVLRPDAALFSLEVGAGMGQG